MIEELKKEIEVQKEVLSTLPKNNKKNIEKYKDSISKELEKYKVKEEDVIKEIKSRKEAVLAKLPKEKYADKLLQFFCFKLNKKFSLPSS